MAQVEQAYWTENNPSGKARPSHAASQTLRKMWFDDQVLEQKEDGWWLMPSDEQVHGATVQELRRRGLIEQDPFHLRTWRVKRAP